MPLPSAEVLTQPVTCFPAWYPRFVAYGGRKTADIVTSGCSTSGGNVQCNPEAMARAAGQKIGMPVSLEAYTLARYLASEVGSGPVAEKVAVAQAALNRVRYVETRTGNILNLLLYRQPVGHPNRGYYGPIHSEGLSAPYGRWAATSRDPTRGDILIALGILNGEIDPGFNKGADDQMGPEHLKDPVQSIRSHGARRDYWVGPLPGVDPWRTIQYRHLATVDPASTFGQALIARGVQAMQSPRPNWTSLPTCSASWAPSFNSAGFGAVGTIIGAVILAGTAVFAARAWRRSQPRRQLRGAGLGRAGIAGHRPYTSGRGVTARIKEMTDDGDLDRQRATADRVNAAAAKLGRRALIADVAHEVNLPPARLARLLVPWQRLGWVELDRLDIRTGHDPAKVEASEVEGPGGTYHLIVAPRTLGASARKGPRTGTIEVDPEIVARTVDMAITSFSPCHPDDPDRIKAGYVQPTERLRLDPVRINEAATGASQTVTLEVQPEARQQRWPAVHDRAETMVAPQYTRDAVVGQHVILKPNRLLCLSKDTWKETLSRTLAHELAHTSDPGIPKRTYARWRAGKPQTSHADVDGRDRQAYTAYLNDPAEVAANLTAVQHELRDLGLDLTEYTPDQVLSLRSTRWTDLEPFLTPKNKRRFYKMVARLQDARHAETERWRAHWRDNPVPEDPDDLPQAPG
jgi:hypothetical protein